MVAAITRLTTALLIIPASFTYAQQIILNGCYAAESDPPPAGANCGVTGTLPSSAQNFIVGGSESGGPDNCANECLEKSNCKFFAYSESDATGGPFDGLGGCALYSKNGPGLGFKKGPDPTENGSTKYYARACYFSPSSCDFNLVCNNCASKFLAASGTKGGAFFPTGFAANNGSAPQKRTRFTITGDELSITQAGKKYVGSVPRADPYYKTSTINFVPPSAINVTATALRCYTLGTTYFQCFVQTVEGKYQFDSCPRAGGGKNLLKIEYLEGSYGYGASGDQEGEGVCPGGQRVDGAGLNAVDLVAHR